MIYELATLIHLNKDSNQMVDMKGDINLYKSFNFLSCLTDEESETKRN